MRTFDAFGLLAAHYLVVVLSDVICPVVWSPTCPGSSAGATTASGRSRTCGFRGRSARAAHRSGDVTTRSVASSRATSTPRAPRTSAECGGWTATRIRWTLPWYTIWSGRPTARSRRARQLHPRLSRQPVRVPPRIALHRQGHAHDRGLRAVDPHRHLEHPGLRLMHDTYWIYRVSPDVMFAWSTVPRAKLLWKYRLVKILTP